MDLLRGRVLQGSVAGRQTGEEPERRDSVVYRLSEGAKAKHRERRTRRGPQIGAERCESRRLLADAHRPEVCDSGREALSAGSIGTSETRAQRVGCVSNCWGVMCGGLRRLEFGSKDCTLRSFGHP